jgi:hypothetical protein
MQRLLPPPGTPRELIELFAFYEHRKGIGSVLNAADFSVLDRTTVLTMALGVVGKRRLEQEVPEGYNPRGHLRTLLHSVEFRERARPLILEAFPEKRRAIFIHIPKCAGTDLTARLCRRYPTLQEGQFDVRGHTPEAFFQTLRDFAIDVRDNDTIALSGHERLAYYQTHRLVRPRDWVFTIVREPMALMYSHISYVLTICRSAAVTRRPDGLIWLGLLGLSEIPENASDADMAEIGRQVLHHTPIPLRNPICHSLGDDSASTALDRIIEGNVEITDMSRYAAWRRRAFPGVEETHANASVPYFRDEVATPRDRDFIASATEEDRKFFAMITKRLDRVEGLSIRGREFR